MAVAAIICEYNPFHRGHARQFELTRRALGADTAIVCLMSGCFVQRGEPAIVPPLARAKAALQSGADLVLENPVTNVLRSAEGYALGSVSLLNALGVVDVLSFGCECADAEALMKLARLLRSDAFSEALRPELDRGLSFAAARERAAAALGGESALLEQPNNILGVEYCKALLATDSPMTPLVIHREGDYHAAALTDPAPAATTIRQAMLAGEEVSAAVPAEALAAIGGETLHSWTFGEKAVLARLRTLPQEAFAALPHGEEGLWSRFHRAARTHADLEQILTAAKSKRYARTRLQRLMTCAYLGLDAQTLNQSAPYVRVLGFTERGRALLRTVKDRADLSVLNAGTTPADRDYFALEERCVDLYELCAEGAGEFGRLRAWRVLQETEK